MESPWLETSVWQIYDNNNVAVITVNLNESLSTVNSYINNHNLTFPVLVNGLNLYWEYGNGYVPYNVVIDQGGYITYTTSGWNSSAILSQIDGLITSVEETGAVTNSFRLMQNYPNPFNPETTIRIQVPGYSQVSLKIYNIKGQVVKTLVSRYLPGGEYQYKWAGVNDNGQAVSSGMYFYKIQAGSFTAIKKMILIR